MGDAAGGAEPSERPFSARALQALAGTRPWALLAGFALLAQCLLGLARGAAELAQAPSAASGPYQAGRVAGLIVATLVVTAIDAALAWYALRYGNRLRAARRRESPGLAAALRAQHAYWRLQAVLIIVFLALVVIGLLLFVAGLALAPH